MNCPACCKKPMRVEHRARYHYAESGLTNVWLLDMNVYHCDQCSEELVTLPRLLNLHQTIARALARKTGRLCGEEVRFLRKWLHWSKTECGTKLGATRETVIAWENDGEPIHVTAEQGLRGTIDDHQSLLAYSERFTEPPLCVNLRYEPSGWHCDPGASTAIWR